MHRSTDVSTNTACAAISETEDICQRSLARRRSLVQTEPVRHRNPAKRSTTGPIVDWGIPVEVPGRVMAEMAGNADVHAVVVRNGVVLHAPGELDSVARPGWRHRHSGGPYGRSTEAAQSPAVRCGTTAASSTM